MKGRVMMKFSKIMGERKKRRIYKLLKRKMTKILKDNGIPQENIDLFFSDSAAGKFIRNRVGQFFLDNGVPKEDVEEMFRYL